MSRTISTFLVFAIIFSLFSITSSVNAQLIATPNPPSVSNSVIDVGQYTTFNTFISNGIAPYTGNWVWIPPNFGESLTLSNTIFAELSNANSIMTLHPQASNSIVFTFNGQSYIVNTFGTNAIFGKWNFLADAIDSSNANAINIYPNNVIINPAFVISANPVYAPPVVGTNSNAVLSMSVNGGSYPYAYNWFSGNVVGGYDQLIFSTVPPFGMPKPPKPNSPPTPMFSYQNPGNTLTVTPFAWNGDAFNAMAISNPLAIPAGNETSLAVYLPDLFTVTSQLPGAFTIQVPANALPPAINPTSSVMYNLDSYSLTQSNTLNASTIYSSNSPRIVAALAANTVGINVTLVNNGVSAAYASDHSPFAVVITGTSQIPGRTGVRNGITFVEFNALNANGGHEYSVANFMMTNMNFTQQNGNPLFDNITSVSIVGPPLPAPGVTISIYDSINTMVSANSAGVSNGNNILLAVFTYNGPRLLYNSTGDNYYASIPAIGSNIVLYNGENSVPVNVILTANTLVDGTVPTNSVTYFTYNVPEIDANGQAPNSFFYVNLTNASHIGFYPTYSFARMFGANFLTNTYYFSGSTGSMPEELTGNVTPRGGVFGPITPFSFSYYMPTNIVSFGGAPISSSNALPFNSIQLNNGANILKFTATDHASVPESVSKEFGTIVAPPIQEASATISNSTLHVGQTSLITIRMKGGQAPYTGYWSFLPPSAHTTLQNTMTLTLPSNVITLLVNVTSANTILFTPTLGTNSTYGGGKNNSVLLYISDNNAYLKLPSFGGQPPNPLLLATDLPSNTIFGIWGANTTVSGSDPGRNFTVLNTSLVTSTASFTDSNAGGGLIRTITSNQSQSYSVNYYDITGISFNGVTTENNESPWYVYLNGALVAKTASAYSFSEEAQPGTYDFEFKNPGANIYSPYSINVTLNVQTLPGGGGGGGVQQTTIATTVSTTTHTTTLPTTVATTIPVPPVPTFSNNTTVGPTPKIVHFEGVHMDVQTTSNVSSNASLLISNLSGSKFPSLPNETELSAANISVSTGANVTITVTEMYNCSYPPASVAPYELRNNSWIKILPFTVNVSACTLTFSIPKDPIIGVFSQKTAPATSSTSLPTTLPTTLQTTAQQNATVPTPQPAAGSSGNATTLEIVVIIVIIILALLFFNSKRKKEFGKGR